MKKKVYILNDQHVYFVLVLGWLFSGYNMDTGAFCSSILLCIPRKMHDHMV